PVGNPSLRFCCILPPAVGAVRRQGRGPNLFWSRRDFGGCAVGELVGGVCGRNAGFATREDCREAKLRLCPGNRQTAGDEGRGRSGDERSIMVLPEGAQAGGGGNSARRNRRAHAERFAVEARSRYRDGGKGAA